jgi:hypothetical protein
MEGAMPPSAGTPGRFVGGFILVMLGLLLFLDRLGLLDFGRALARGWPSLLILFGAWDLARHGARKLGGALVLIVLGILLQLSQFGWMGGRLAETLWPLLLVAAGLWFMFRPRRGASPPAAPGARP